VIAWARRTVAFARFCLAEYVRSGRILVEAVAVVAVVWLIFWPHGSRTGLNVVQFFSLGGVSTLALAGYTSAAFATIGNRAEGYVVLVRPLGRAGYLTGLYLASLAVVLASYVALTLLAIVVNLAPPLPATLGVLDWLLGSLPLLLDATAVVGFAFLLTPLVLPIGPRLALLAFLALGLSIDLRLGPAIAVVQAALAAVLLPVALGYSLAFSRAYAAGWPAIIVAQCLLAGLLFAVALVASRRRDLILG
jgi:hypothetical protein